jgi:hypothetical protein
MTASRRNEEENSYQIKWIRESHLFTFLKSRIQKYSRRRPPTRTIIHPGGDCANWRSQRTRLHLTPLMLESRLTLDPAGNCSGTLKQIYLVIARRKYQNLQSKNVTSIRRCVSEIGCTSAPCIAPGLDPFSRRPNHPEIYCLLREKILTVWVSSTYFNRSPLSATFFKDRSRRERGSARHLTRSGGDLYMASDIPVGGPTTFWRVSCLVIWVGVFSPAIAYESSWRIDPQSKRN